MMGFRRPDGAAKHRPVSGAPAKRHRRLGTGTGSRAPQVVAAARQGYQAARLVGALPPPEPHAVLLVAARPFSAVGSSTNRLGSGNRGREGRC
jgi:hypothetical protein